MKVTFSLVLLYCTVLNYSFHLAGEMFYDVAKTCLEKPVAKAPKGSELIINYSLTLLRYPNQVRLTTCDWTWSRTKWLVTNEVKCKVINIW
jgi:hypothetical protein